MPLKRITNFLQKLFNFKKPTYQPILPPEFVIPVIIQVGTKSVYEKVPLKLYVEIDRLFKLNERDKIIQIKKECEKYFPVSEIMSSSCFRKLIIKIGQQVSLNDSPKEYKYTYENAYDK